MENDHIEAVGRSSEAYPGIELVDFRGNLQDVNDKETVTSDHFRTQHDQKQADLSQESTNTSVGFLEGDALRYKNDLPHGPLLRCVSNRSWRNKRLRIFCILAVITIIVIVVSVGVGVGVGVSRDKNASTSTHATSNGAASAATPAPTGVLTGSRLTAMDPRTGGDIYLYYQYGDGSLRYISQSPERIWQGNTNLQVTNARLGTPLAAVSTSTNGSIFWWLFYVDESSIIQNIYSQSDPTTWQQGSVGSNRYEVPNQTSIAFTVSRGREFNASSNDLGGGLSLYASGTDRTIHEYIFNDLDGSWSDGFIFSSSDGSGGATTYSIGSNAFFFALGSDQTMELWWRNYNSSSSNSDNSWHLGPSSHDSVFQDAGLCAQYLIAYQGSSEIIQGSNFSASADPAAVRWGNEFNISNQSAISGSAVSCWYFYPSPDASDNLMFQVFYQVQGNLIEEARKKWGPGNATLSADWTYGIVPTQ